MQPLNGKEHDDFFDLARPAFLSPFFHGVVPRASASHPFLPPFFRNFSPAAAGFSFAQGSPASLGFFFPAQTVQWYFFSYFP